MVEIANPIYDVVFRYLMEDNKVAKLMLSTLIDEEIEELTFKSTENSYKDSEIPTVLRMDFAATIKTKKGEHKQILIELQKANYYVETMRFRRYIGEQYNDPNLKIERKSTDKSGRIYIDGIPLLPIYFLGEKLTKENIPVIKVAREYIDVATQKAFPFKHKFVEALTHDGIFVQIPYITGNQRTDLEKLLYVFDQSNRADTSNHILAIKEENYPKKYHAVIRRLKKAIANRALLKKMRVEDDFISIFKHKEREAREAVLEATRELRQQTQKEIEQAKQKIEQAKQETEQAKQKIEQAKQETEQAKQETEQAKQETEQAQAKNIQLIQKMKKIGLTIPEIAQTAAMSEEEIIAILQKEK